MYNFSRVTSLTPGMTPGMGKKLFLLLLLFNFESAVRNNGVA